MPIANHSPSKFRHENDFNGPAEIHGDKTDDLARDQCGHGGSPQSCAAGNGGQLAYLIIDLTPGHGDCCCSFYAGDSAVAGFLAPWLL